MNWNIRNDAPVYTQLVDQIARAIILGQFPPGGRLPSPSWSGWSSSGRSARPGAP